MIDCVSRIDSSRYVVFECSVVCWGVEDVSAGVFVAVKEDVSEGVVIVAT